MPTTSGTPTTIRPPASVSGVPANSGTQTTSCRPSLAPACQQSSTGRCQAPPCRQRPAGWPLAVERRQISGTPTTSCRPALGSGTPTTFRHPASDFRATRPASGSGSPTNTGSPTNCGIPTMSYRLGSAFRAAPPASDSATPTGSSMPMTSRRPARAPVRRSCPDSRPQTSTRTPSSHHDVSGGRRLFGRRSSFPGDEGWPLALVAVGCSADRTHGATAGDSGPSRQWLRRNGPSAAAGKRRSARSRRWRDVLFGQPRPRPVCEEGTAQPHLVDLQGPRSPAGRAHVLAEVAQHVGVGLPRRRRVVAAVGARHRRRSVRHASSRLADRRRIISSAGLGQGGGGTLARPRGPRARCHFRIVAGRRGVSAWKQRGVRRAAAAKRRQQLRARRMAVALRPRRGIAERGPEAAPSRYGPRPAPRGSCDTNEDAAASSPASAAAASSRDRSGKNSDGYG